MENEKTSTEDSQKQANGKKKGKIAKVYSLHEKGLSAKEIATKLKINERLVRSYIWRMRNPQKYRELVKRYFEKKKGKEVLAIEAEGKPVEAEKVEKKKK